MSESREPSTEAGRTLFSRLWAVDDYARTFQIIATVQHDIVAIEDEARSTPEVRRLATAMRAVDAVEKRPVERYIGLASEIVAAYMATEPGR